LATILAEKVLYLRPRQRPGEWLFADAFEHGPNGMALLDSFGTITHANIAFRKLLGFSGTELPGLASSEITHPDDIETDAEQRRRLGSGEIDRYQLVQRLIRKNGAAIRVLLSVSVRRRTSEFPEYYVLQVDSGAGHLSVEDGAAHDALVERVSEAVHEIGNTLTPLMLNAELIVEQSKTVDICDSAYVIFKAARRIAFTLRRLRGIKDLQAGASLGPGRMLDLRMVPPPKEVD
jgi:PAS domain S-box-containing protein